MIVIIGGNGYIGRNIAKHAINRGFKVTCVSRSGVPKEKTHWDSKITYVKGNALRPEEFTDLLKESDKIIHSVGILRANSEKEYTELNRDSAISVAKHLEYLSSSSSCPKKKLVLISSSHYPPFMKKYLDTKEEAEAYIKTLEHINYAILKPGFIYSAKERWWSSPLSGPLDFAHCLLGKKDLGVAKFESTISLNEVCLTALSALESPDDKKVYMNEDIAKIAGQYKALHNIIFTV